MVEIPPRGERQSFRFSSGDTPLLNRLLDYRFFAALCEGSRGYLCYDRARSKRSRFMTLFHAATKSCRNFSWESSHA